VLKGVFNFSPATTVLQAAAWLLYFIPTLAIFLHQKRRRTQAAPPRPAAQPVGASESK
jgi:high-affinity iron transporter